MKNAKTTISGILAIALPILTMIYKLLNGEPLTAADIGILSTSIPNGVGLIYAKDAHTPETTIVQPMTQSGPTKIGTKAK